jgi:hypothetical protein
MNAALTTAAAVALIVAAQGARVVARDLRTGQAVDEPLAPSPAATPFVSVGYRELTADLLLARVMPYFGGADDTAEGVAGLCEAIVAADPQLRPVYTWCARAMTLARRGVDHRIDQRTSLRAIALLEGGMRELPDDWQIPYTAGQMYMLDLQTDDPAQRRAWDERGARMIEAAIRKPYAPAEAATTAAFLRTKLGQHQRAIDGLREMLLITRDDAARRRILDKLAELSNGNADELAAELLEARRRFEDAWRRDHPAVPASMYLLIGPRPAPGFDPRDLATGGRDLIGERLVGE